MAEVFCGSDKHTYKFSSIGYLWSGFSVDLTSINKSLVKHRASMAVVFDGPTKQNYRFSYLGHLWRRFSVDKTSINISLAT